MQYLEQKAHAVEKPDTLLQTIQPLYFNIGSTKLTAESQERLTRYTVMLKPLAFKEILVEGHTSEDNPSMNMNLSQSRADSVRDYLVSQGIPAIKILAVGKGAREPVRPGDNAYNMRVELRIIK